jgi:hypothetical protein
MARTLTALQYAWTGITVISFAALGSERDTLGAGFAAATTALLAIPRLRWLVFGAAPAHVILLADTIVSLPALFIACSVVTLATLNELFEQRLVHPWSRVLARLAMFSVFSIASAAIVLVTWQLSNGVTKVTFRAFLPWPLTMLVTLFAIAALDKLREEH